MNAETSYKIALPKGVESGCLCTVSSLNSCCLELLSTCEAVQGCTDTAVPAAAGPLKVTFLTWPILSKGRNQREWRTPSSPLGFGSVHMPCGTHSYKKSRMKGLSSNQTDQALGANTLPPSHTCLCGPGLRMFPPQAKGDCSTGPLLYYRVRQQPVLLLAHGPMF